MEKKADAQKARNQRLAKKMKKSVYTETEPDRFLSMTTKHTIRVTFTNYSNVLKRQFVNVKDCYDLEGAQLFAMSMNWQIVKIEQI
jgi:hypothetical protein